MGLIRVVVWSGVIGLCGMMVPPASAWSPADDTVLRDYLSGNGLLNRGLYELAAAEYTRFLDAHGAHPKAPLARYGLAVCEFRTAQYGDAAEILKSLRPLVAPQFPYAAEVAVMLGQCELLQDRPAQAVPHFAAVATSMPDHPLAADAAANWVEALYRASQYDAIPPIVVRMTRDWPTHARVPRALFFGALAHQGMGQFEPAVKLFEELLQRDPDGPFVSQARLQMAHCYQRLARPDQAALHFQAVAEMPGGLGAQDALLGLAVVLQEQQRYDAAVAALDRLLASTPTESLRRAGELERGRCLFHLSRLDEAATIFSALRQGGGARADEAAYLLGKCRLRQNRPADAAAAFSEALAAHPTTSLAAQMRYDRAIALVQADDDGAIAALAEFLDRHAGHAMAADALNTLASFTHHRGQYDTSQKHCAEFLRTFPGHASSAAVSFLTAENAYLQQQLEAAVGRYEAFIASYDSAEQVPLARFRLGMALHQLGRDADAEPILAEVVRQGVDQRLRAAHLALGDVYFDKASWAPAATQFERYLQLDETSPAAADALMKLGLAQQRQGALEPALATYSRLLKHFGDSIHAPQARFERGQALLQLNRPEEAEAALKDALGTDPESRFAEHSLRHLGTLAMQQERFADAAGFYGRIEGDPAGGPSATFDRAQALMAARQYEDALAALDRFIAAHPQDSRIDTARAHRGIALARLQRWNTALPALQGVERLDDLPGDLAATVAYETAWAARHLQKVDVAERAYAWILEHAGTVRLAPHALVERAELAYSAGRWEDTLAALASLDVRLAQPDPAVPDGVREQALYMRGVAQFELQQFAEAVSTLQNMISSFPDSARQASANFFAGEAAFRIDRFDAAAQHLQRLVDAYPEDAARAPGLLRLGESQARRQQWAQSAAAFGQYLEHFPTGEHAYQARYGIGWALENQQRYADAIASYQQVVARHQGVTAARAQFQIGECLYAQKHHQEAVAEFLKVDILYAYPEWSAAALYEAARCFEALARMSEAREHYGQVTQKHPDTRWADLARQRLESMPRSTVPGR